MDGPLDDCKSIPSLSRKDGKLHVVPLGLDDQLLIINHNSTFSTWVRQTIYTDLDAKRNEVCIQKGHDLVSDDL